MVLSPSTSSPTGGAQPSVLDCTLRDGGYYTRWDFSEATVNKYFDSVARLPISVVEAGYCSVPQPGYRGRFHYLTPNELKRVRARLHSSQRLAVMLDAKSHTPEDIEPLMSGCQGIVDIVRLAVSHEALESGAALGRALVDLGFEVGINIMYLSRWWDHVSALQGLDKVRDVATTIALVDSFGACEPDQVAEAVTSMRGFAPQTQIGFHGHDNLGLALANSLAAAASGATVIDSTMSGMGRGAGNTSTQALLVRQAARSDSALDLEALESVVREFDELKLMHGWGTSLPYLISGASDLAQKDVMDWVSKNRYSMVSILRALKGGSSDGIDHREFAPLSRAEHSDEVLLIGGGESVAVHIEALAQYVSLTGARVVHSSHRHIDHRRSLGAGQLFCLTGDGTFVFPSDGSDPQLGAFIVAVGPRLAGTVYDGLSGDIRQVAPFATEAHSEHLGPVPDTAPLALGLGAALALGASRISLVGFDGYEHASLAKQALAAETQLMLDAFRERHASIELRTLTPSTYGLPTASLYGLVSKLHSTALGR